MIQDIHAMQITETKKTPVCYPYLSGYLEQTMASLARELVAAELADPMAVWAIQAYINSKILAAHAAERAHSIG